MIGPLCEWKNHVRTAISAALMTKMNVDFSDKWRIRKCVLNKASPTVCLLVPCAKTTQCRGRNAAYFWAALHNWKMLGIKWKATIQVCVKVNASTFFFLLECEDLRKHFLCTSRRWGNENNVEWMQGLRAPCPACADESQRPDLIHTPGSNQQKHMHTGRKVPAHA